MRLHLLPASVLAACALLAPAQTSITILTRDDHRGIAVIRKPPGKGPFPAIVFLHGGLSPVPESQLQEWSRSGPTPNRFLEAGYITVIPTFRSRAKDPQSTDALWDATGVIEHLMFRMPEVDARSIVAWGCSGGGSLALDLAGQIPLAAVVAEEPATVLFTGMFHKGSPKQGAEFTPADAQPLMDDPRKFYLPEMQRNTREKIRWLMAPVLILRGDQHPINRFNSEILAPELKAAGKRFEEKVYPGEPHCFGFIGDRRPEAAAKAFADADGFFRRFLKTEPGKAGL